MLPRFGGGRGSQAAPGALRANPLLALRPPPVELAQVPRADDLLLNPTPSSSSLSPAPPSRPLSPTASLPFFGDGVTRTRKKVEMVFKKLQE